MVKFENFWLFERSEFQRFSNFIIAQCMAEIRTKPQIVFGLNITADGNVPLSFNLFDGNRTDDTTHIPSCQDKSESLG